MLYLSINYYSLYNSFISVLKLNNYIIFNMQTDYREEKDIDSKDQIDNILVPCFFKNKQNNSATSVSSRDNTSKKKPDLETTIISHNQIHFIDDFITAKNDALKPVITHYSHSNSIKKNNAAIKKWYILLNVVLPIVQLRKIKTHYISAKTIEYLTNKSKCILQTKAKVNKDDVSKEDTSLDYIRKQIKLFDHIENGFISSINEILTLINENNKLINDYNYNGMTPLYAACINGHRTIVELFLNTKADYLLLCNEESVLDASIRFSYVDIVKVLMQKCNWPVDYMKRSKTIVKDHQNKVIREMVLNWKNKKFGNIFNKCFCFN